MRLCQSAARQILAEEMVIPIQASMDSASIEDYAAELYSDSIEQRRLEIENHRLNLIRARSPLQQQIIHLRAQGLSWIQIAEILGSTASTVRNAFHQARTWIIAHDLGTAPTEGSVGP